ncbi:MAG TPA: phosphoglycerate dehydrogenase [Pseudonocardiaceae bacterium]|nr:phosphoglycerate dehydrogenase [Pseudonocardiaceae bacterium]
MTNSNRPVVLIAEALAESTLDIFGDEVEIRHVDGTDRPAMFEAMASADALLVRSATRVDAELLGHAPRLKVVARAGVGLDNVDVDAATAAGVMVVNAPTSNIVSAAEHAVALLLAVARRVPAADASLRAGQWRRSAFSGIELAGKVVGVLGLGRIGQLFAQRLAAFGTKLIAYDPYVSPARATQLGIELVDLDELFARADIISIHLPKTPETRGLIGARELAKAKPGLLIINAARGGLVDEQALAAAIRDGQVAGAGIDVFETEPTTSSPLFDLPQVVVTPHLGASTAEAQDRAGTDVARSVLLALRGEFVPDAVNVQSGGTVSDVVRPYLGLTRKLGRLAAALSQHRLVSVTVDVCGELSSEDLRVLPLAALRGVFAGAADSPVTFVNAPRLAQELGVTVDLTVAPESTDHRNLVTVRVIDSDGLLHTVSGTVTGLQQVEKLVGVNGRHFDLRAEGTVVVLEYADRPGVMGTVGTLLGEAGVNIEAAQISPATGRGALMLLRADRPVDAAVLDSIGAAVGATLVRAVTFE